MYHNQDGHSSVFPPALNHSGQAVQNCLMHLGMMMRIIETTLLYGKHRTHNGRLSNML
jgi:hypothetical protein